MSDQRTDEARWRDAGKPQTMTLEQRAEYIAAARGPRSITGGAIWTKLRDRALDQLREVDALARKGHSIVPQPLFSTAWDREDYDRRQRGEPELGPGDAEAMSRPIEP